VLFRSFNRYDRLLSSVNLQNLYGWCFKNDTTPSLPAGKRDSKIEFENLFRKCQFYAGINSYFKINKEKFRGVKDGFQACNETIYELYTKTEAGSMNEYARIITEVPGVSIYFYNGDWDATVPFTDTLKNLERLGMRQNGTLTPIIDTASQHVGFSRTFLHGTRQLTLWTVKGAGLKGPLQKGATLYTLYKTMLGR
jgi:hypothetical protein